MTANRILRELLHVNGAVIDNFELREGAKGSLELVAHVHPLKRERWKCPVCGRKCRVHDYACGEAFWRGLDFAHAKVTIGAAVPRVECQEHGVLTAAAPWAEGRSHFVREFAYMAAWLTKGGLNKTKVSELLRIDWDTVGRLISLVWDDLEPTVTDRFNGLVKIGIDETSYRKGHEYITTVVNHDTNTVVWAHVGFGKEVVELFFEQLTEEQRRSIEAVSGDGAKWITDAVDKYCPNAERCLDPFHCVEWANAALDAVRVEAWHRALEKHAEIVRANKDKGCKNSGEAKAMLKKANEIKHSKYAVCKNPENLTEAQRERLSVLREEDGELIHAHALKEELRAVFKVTNPKVADECLDRWIERAGKCGIKAFEELQEKIMRHRQNILNAISCGISNARVEAINNKIKLLIRIAYGFRNLDTMIDLIMLFCSNIEIPLLGRYRKAAKTKDETDTKPSNDTHTHA